MPRFDDKSIRCRCANSVATCTRIASCTEGYRYLITNFITCIFSLKSSMKEGLQSMHALDCHNPRFSYSHRNSKSGRALTDPRALPGTRPTDRAISESFVDPISALIDPIAVFLGGMISNIRYERQPAAILFGTRACACSNLHLV